MARSEMVEQLMRILGIIMAYDEADCIQHAIRSLIPVCDDVYVFHHGKDTETRTAIYGSCKPAAHLYVEGVNEISIPFAVDKVQSNLLWNYIGQFVRSQAIDYDWVIWQAADELLRSPDGALVSRAAIEHEADAGIDVIRPLIRNFWMTDADNGSSSYLERIKYYKTAPKGHAPRAWRIDLTPADIPIGLHIQDPATGKRQFPFYGLWPVGTNVSNNNWLLDHYPARTEIQFRKKVSARNCKTSTGEQRFKAYRSYKTPVVKDHNRITLEVRALEMP